MKKLAFLMVPLLVAACDPPVPDSAARYEERLREQELSGQAAPLPAPTDVVEETLEASNAPAANGQEVGDNPGLSDENDFSAVSARQTIESDAERIARNKALYKQYEPTALPKRTGNVGPSVVTYALQTNNPVGATLYARGSFASTKRMMRSCARYGSSDEAQRDFLVRGGPQRDPRGVDPDGDGYACDWDPTPFRAARQAE